MLSVHAEKKVHEIEDFENEETYSSVPAYDSSIGAIRPQFLAGIHPRNSLKTLGESHESSGNYQTAVPILVEDNQDKKQMLKNESNLFENSKSIPGDLSEFVSKSYIEDFDVTPVLGSNAPILIGSDEPCPVSDKEETLKRLKLRKMQTVISEHPFEFISRKSDTTGSEKCENKFPPVKNEVSNNEYIGRNKKSEKSDSDVVIRKNSGDKCDRSSPNYTDRGPRKSDDLYVNPASVPSANRDSLSQNKGTINWNVLENLENNFTSNFRETFLVVRRGFPIKFQITTGELERVKFYNIPSKSEGLTIEPPRNMVEVALTRDKPTYAEWALEEGENGEITVRSAPNCIIGLWLIKIRVSGEDYRKEVRILFNPWCREDEVFLEDEELRHEYVLNENGRLFAFKGAFFPWFYGQFEHHILDIVLYLLDKTNLNTLCKSSAVFVARALSHIIVHDEKTNSGIISARWQEPFSGGYDPKHWNNSVEILNKYFKTRSHVSYGQCWVFSAVLITTMRALGIPCRAVTSESSFHDSSRSSMCEWEVLNDGSVKRLEQIWNFHVWVEVWMKRDDLPGNYGGWQALDATPQELFQGLGSVGPASVIAIKQAAVHLPYDTAFLFSEVNADLAFWKRDKSGQLEKIIKIESDKIGRRVVTKEVSKWKADDITSSYKNDEHNVISVEEKMRILVAINPGINTSLYEKFYWNESKLRLKLTAPDYIALGNGFEFSAEVEMDKIPPSSVANITITVFVSTNTGQFIGQVMKREYKQMDLSKLIPLKMRIEYGNYRRFAGSGYVMKLFATCHLKKPFEAIDCDFLAVPFHCRAPEINVISSIPFIQSQPVDIKLSFVNEFNFGLSGCYFELCAPSMKPKAFGIKKGLASGESCYIHLQYKPRRSGEVMLIVKFGCREISVMCGSAIIDVLKKSIDPT